jgi:hypothetical protein
MAAVDPKGDTMAKYGELLLSRGFSLSEKSAINESGNSIIIYTNSAEGVGVDLVETEEDGLKLLTILIYWL